MISLRGPKLKIFAGILAAICLVAGVYFTFFQSRGFEETTATIVDLVEEGFDDDTTYWPIVEYEVDGVSYTGRLDRSGHSYSIGKTITIFYNPENPEIIHGDGQLGIYLIIVSTVILAIVIFSTITGRKNQKEVRELRSSRGHTGYAPSMEGEERELYFLTDLGTLKNGHRIEDRYKKVLYEAKMTKFSPAAAHKFDFIDHEHGTAVPHLVGHEEQSEWGSLLIDNHYTFELDGVDVWKHLKENGISIETSYTAGQATLLGMQYQIFRDGQEIALAEVTSQYPHEEDAVQHKVAGALPVRGFYRVWTKEQYLDLLFMTLMAFARCNASDDNGGTNGAIIGTIKKQR